jgi:hypothetical protein
MGLLLLGGCQWLDAVSKVVITLGRVHYGSGGTGFAFVFLSIINVAPGAISCKRNLQVNVSSGVTMLLMRRVGD